jgi:hypothetical protein
MSVECLAPSLETGYAPLKARVDGIGEVTGRPRFHLQSEAEGVVCEEWNEVLCIVLL